MLISNVDGERVAGSMMKDSKTYIEVAKFVQAYRTIVENPNAFLDEVGEIPLKDKEKLSWEQFIKIMKLCDFGFETVPSEIQLKVLYNYALEMGSIDRFEKTIATVKDVADAQKNYYNFVDDSAEMATVQLAKQHQIYENREREASFENKLVSSAKAKRNFDAVMMYFGALLIFFSVISVFAPNVITIAFGTLFGFENPNYFGCIVFGVVGLVLFAIFYKRYLKASIETRKIVDASKVVTNRSKESLEDEVVLKKKYNLLKKDQAKVIAEINDKTKKYDVQNNIDLLLKTNKYYLKFKPEEELEDIESLAVDDDDVPVKLTKEQEENVRRVGKEAIMTQGQFDVDAYNQKFEVSEKKEDKKTSEKKVEQKQVSKKQIEEEKSISEKLKKQQEEVDKQRRIEEEQKQNKENAELNESIDYIKDILGFQD